MTVTLENPPAGPARHPTGANGWLVIGGIFTAVLVALGGLSVAGWLGYRSETQTQTYRMSITNLAIDLSNGDLQVTVGPDDQIVVTRRLHWSYIKPTFAEAWDGQQLTVTQSCGSYLLPGPNCGIDYTVQVPAGTWVRAQADTGDLRVENVGAPVELDTSTGDISVTGAVAGDLSVHSSTGDISAMVASASHVDASTDTGDVTLRLVDPPQSVTVHTGTGDVRVTVPQGGVYHVQTDTGTGDSSVTVDTSDTAARSITVRTGTGDVGVAYA